MIAARFMQGAGFLFLASCTGMLHEIGGRKDLVTTATFEMYTNSDYDDPTADWSVLESDDYLSHFECLVERLDQVTDEVIESGVWMDCESPYALQEASGIDVQDGFHGQLTVRAVSRNGQAGEAITKPFRRAFWAGGMSDAVSTIVPTDSGLLLGGYFGGFRSENATSAGGILRINKDGSSDLSTRSFLRGFSGSVWSVAVQEDGKILVGGDFTSYNGDVGAPDGLIRLNPDGSVDATFDGIAAGFNGTVRTVLAQPDGKILVGGFFTSYNGAAGAPDHFIRLNSNGSVDTGFSGLTSGFNGSGVNTIVIQSDGNILVGGSFTSYNGAAGVPDRLIRLTTNGDVDASFNGITSGVNNSSVDTITVQSDGKILVGGGFTSYNGAAGAPDRLIRLNSNGSLDATFSGITSGFDSSVSALAIESDGKILVGGSFASYNAAAGAPDCLIRLNADGSVDASFSGITSGFDGGVSAITIQVDGKILVGGNFLSYNGVAGMPYRLIRLNSDGSVDASFTGLTGGFNGSVQDIAMQQDGKILVGGGFTVYNHFASPPAGLIGLNALAGTDQSFVGLTSGFDAWIEEVVVQPDRKILVGGYFFSYNGVGGGPERLLRLNPDGSVDPSFSGPTSGFNHGVRAVALQQDGKILLGGEFSEYNGVAGTPDGFIRLNTDGSFDSTFIGNTDGFNMVVNEIVIQGDGKILVGGLFDSYNGVAGVPDGLIRLNTDGSVDASFSGITSGFDSQQVMALAIQSDGKILVGGSFTSYNGAAGAPDYLIRLNANGSVDSSFSGITSGFDGTVYTIAIQADGKILVGGQFTTYNGVAGAPDGLVRLNSDGSLDASFTGITSGFNGYIEAITVQSDGKILVGGGFSAYNENPGAPDNIIRLNADGSIDQSFMGQRK